MVRFCDICRQRQCPLPDALSLSQTRRVQGVTGMPFLPSNRNPRRHCATRFIFAKSVERGDNDIGISSAFRFRHPENLSTSAPVMQDFRESSQRRRPLTNNSSVAGNHNLPLFPTGCLRRRTPEPTRTPSRSRLASILAKQASGRRTEPEHSVKIESVGSQAIADCRRRRCPLVYITVVGILKKGLAIRYESIRVARLRTRRVSDSRGSISLTDKGRLLDSALRLLNVPTLMATAIDVSLGPSGAKVFVDSGEHAREKLVGVELE